MKVIKVKYIDDREFPLARYWFDDGAHVSFELRNGDIWLKDGHVTEEHMTVIKEKEGISDMQWSELLEEVC